MKMLCDECIDFFHISVQENVFFTYSDDLCEGCFKKTRVKNPKFWLKLVKSDSNTCASNATTEYEKEISL